MRFRSDGYRRSNEHRAYHRYDTYANVTHLEAVTPDCIRSTSKRLSGGYRISNDDRVQYDMDKRKKKSTSSIIDIIRMYIGHRTNITLPAQLKRQLPYSYDGTYHIPSSARNIINTSYQKLPFGSGDYPDKLIST